MVTIFGLNFGRSPVLGQLRRTSGRRPTRTRRRRVLLGPEAPEGRELLSPMTPRVPGEAAPLLLDRLTRLAGTRPLAVTARPAATSIPRHFFAPFVDMSLSELYFPERQLIAKGVKYFNLAFVTAPRSSGTDAVWGGNSSDAVGGPFDTSRVLPVLNSVRQHGGDVMIVFGGAGAGDGGFDLAERIADVNTLAQTYLQVINTYDVTHVNFDIEGAALFDPASIERRSEALAMVQQALAAHGKTLDVWFTLPCNPDIGLTTEGYGVIQSAINAGVKVSGVNILTMDFGTFYAAGQPGQMGALVISAANQLFNQLQRLYPSFSAARIHEMMGITPMIGQNDTENEVFYARDATMLDQYARQNGIGMVADWSLNRDRPKPGANPVDTVANPNWSGIASTDLEFAGLLAKSVT
jgi:chitinase